jgi:hypothetical protein
VAALLVEHRDEHALANKLDDPLNFDGLPEKAHAGRGPRLQLISNLILLEEAAQVVRLFAVGCGRHFEGVGQVALVALPAVLRVEHMT